jgi:hypothetical protein
MNNEKDIKKIVSPTDGTVIFYDVVNNNIISFEYGEKGESNFNFPGKNNTEDNAGRKDRACNFGGERMESAEKEKGGETESGDRKPEPDSENIFKNDNENEYSLNNW